MSREGDMPKLRMALALWRVSVFEIAHDKLVLAEIQDKIGYSIPRLEVLRLVTLE